VTRQKYNSGQLQAILLMRNETHIEIADDLAFFKAGGSS
jgi:hypothetical protein